MLSPPWTETRTGSVFHPSGHVEARRIKCLHRLRKVEEEMQQASALVRTVHDSKKAMFLPVIGK
jgi:hypothetical protein